MDNRRSIKKSYDESTLRSRLPRVSEGGQGLFADKAEESSRVKALLKYVMNGNTVAVARLLKQHQQEYPHECLVVMRETGKEKNGRKWNTPVSPLEFSAWTGDMISSDSENNPGMVNLLLKFVPPNYISEAKQQLQKVRDSGTEHGAMMMPFDDLIKVYKKFNDEFNLFKDASERMHYCETSIRQSQDRLTHFGLQWLCSGELFMPLFLPDQAPQRKQTVFTLEDHPSRNFFKCTWGRPRTLLGYMGNGLMMTYSDYSCIMALPHRDLRKDVISRIELFETLREASMAYLDDQISLLQCIEENNKAQLDNKFVSWQYCALM